MATLDGLNMRFGCGTVGEHRAYGVSGWAGAVAVGGIYDAARGLADG